LEQAQGAVTKAACRVKIALRELTRKLAFYTEIYNNMRLFQNFSFGTATLKSAVSQG
jgi:hypothetical protein